MEYIIRIIITGIFICSITGSMYIIQDKLKLEIFFTPVVTFSVITLIVYLGGLMQKLRQTTIIITLLGLIAFAFFIKRKPWIRGARQFASLFHVCFITGSLFFFSILLHTRFQHYDNFSHWAIVVKEMLCTDAFPTAESVMIRFSNYPTGISCWIYYVCRLLGKEQEVMLLAQAIFIFSCFYAMFGIIREKKRFLLYAFMGAGFAILSIFNITIRINNLLVDFILPIMVLTVFAILYYYHENLPKAATAVIPVLGLLGIVKKTGIIFMLFGILYFAYLAFKVPVKPKRDNIFPFTATLLISLIPAALWNLHMKIRFSGVINKFDLSSQTLQATYSNKTPQEIRQIIKLFIQSACDLTKRPAIGILFFEIMAITSCILAWIFLKKRWNLSKALLALNSMLIAYYAGILAMYIFAMPVDEAIYLAGFERYASSIVVLFGGALVLCMTVDIENSFYIQLGDRSDYRAFKTITTKKYYQASTTVCLTTAIMILLSEYNGMKYNNTLYKTSLPAQVKSVTQDRWTKGGTSDTSKYLCYATDKDNQVTDYYLEYVARYMLYAPNVDTLCSFYEDNFINLLKDYDYLVIIETDKNARYLLNKYFNIEAVNGIYNISTLLKKAEAKGYKT